MNEHRAVLIPALSQPGERAGQAERLQVCRAGLGNHILGAPALPGALSVRPAQHNSSL